MRMKTWHELDLRQRALVCLEMLIITESRQAIVRVASYAPSEDDAEILTRTKPRPARERWDKLRERINRMSEPELAKTLNSMLDKLANPLLSTVAEAANHVAPGFGVLPKPTGGGVRVEDVLNQLEERTDPE